METQAGASASFDAAHQVPAYEPCSREHGHFWTVTAMVEGDPDESGWPRGTNALPRAIKDIAAELDHRNLRDMLPGVMTTPTGLAAYFMDRLSGFGVVLVKVDCSDNTTGSVTRIPR